MKPGKQRGKAVRVRYIVPVMFRLQKPAKPATTSAKGDVYEIVEKNPEFPGGQAALMQFLSKNTKYPAEAQKAGKQGRVLLQMIIDKEGNITNLKVAQGVDPLLDAEALRVIGSMPKWKPGTQKGMPVNVRYTIPVMFRVQ